MLAKHSGNHLLHPIFLVHNINSWYKLGTAELFLGGKTTRMKGLPIVFDSGSTYTYFSGEAYKALYSMLMNDMKGKKVYITNEDKSLPVCWKGSKPFKSIYDKNGNACFGILNGSEVGLGNINVIGDISFQDKIIIYDNEKQQIGWTPANCNRLPKS
uniref:Peptidase A1 domain-containing protein n=1 Tax=Lactuca sativa TaxID=4236 RepID=A0A9R1WPK7_LACSA|nr:hypothetical protein LSAT_V11C100020530 [Lactuca sativa]